METLIKTTEEFVTNFNNYEVEEIKTYFKQLREIDIENRWQEWFSKFVLNIEFTRMSIPHKNIPVGRPEISFGNEF